MCRARSLFRVLPLLLAAIGSAHCVPYRDEAAPGSGRALAVTFSCEKKWCGESWQANRVLKYNLTVERVNNSDIVQYSGPVFQCHGEQGSNRCSEPESNFSTEAPPYLTEITRTLSNTTKLNSDEIIFTDNYEPGNSTSLRDYSSNQDILWQIRVPQNCTMKIVFEKFNVEATENCDKDYFAVQITKNQSDIRKYCRDLYSITIQRRRRVQLWFHADDTIQDKGIYAPFCFSAIRPGSPDSFFRCDCNQVSTPTIRRRRSRQNGTPNMASQGVHQSSREERMAGEWLRDLVKRGGHSVEEHQMDSLNPRKQLLAQRHQRIRKRLPSRFA